MASSPRRVRGFRIAAICFFLAGLVWCIAALIGGKVGVNVALGMMNICIGTMFLALTRRKPPGEHKQQTTGQTGPDGAAKPN
jgi:hypothetical protein